MRARGRLSSGSTSDRARKTWVFAATWISCFNARPRARSSCMCWTKTDSRTTAMFMVRDRQQRVYPSQAKRLAPDFAFQPQVYRADGETLRLPEGEYAVEFTRGPEYLTEHQKLEVRRKEQTATFQLHRWIDPSKLGWWSGDHHIHAAGCAHYTRPPKGCSPPTWYRHCQGEDLKVGCNLTWGPCFDFQKRFFTGKDDAVSELPLPAALRHRGVRLRIASIRPPGAAGPERGDLSRRRFRQALADPLPEHFALGEEARGGVWPGAFRLGPGGVHLPNSRTTSCRPTAVSGPTNTSWMSRMKCLARRANPCRRWISCPWWTRPMFGN